MFEKYFVTCPVAIALRAAGFDEPCMGFHQTDSTKTQSKHFYSAEPADIIYNSSLPAHHYAAPLYDQVLGWLEAKGLRLHVYPAPHFGSYQWSVNIFNTEWKCLWPGLTLQEAADFNARKQYFHQDKRDALDQAILEAIKLLSNEH